MKSKLIETKQITNLKFLNMFQSTFEMENGERKVYYFASRRSIDKLGCKDLNYVDAVKVLPYFKKDNKYYVVLNHEFRRPINSYTYDLCAGLVEHQDNIEEDVKRELYEEIGAIVKDVKLIAKAGHTTAGLTDETMSCYMAEIVSMGKQHLEDSEDISLKIISLEEIPQFLQDNSVGITANLLLLSFYYQKTLELSQEHNNQNSLNTNKNNTMDLKNQTPPEVAIDAQPIVVENAAKINQNETTQQKY